MDTKKIFQFTESWAKSCAGTESTQKTYYFAIEKFKKYAAGMPPTLEISEQFRKQLKREKKQKRTINLYLSTIKNYFMWLRENQGIETDLPFIKLEKLEGNSKTSLKDVFSDVELKKFFKELDTDKSIIGVRNKALYTLMYQTGMPLRVALQLDILDIQNNPSGDGYIIPMQIKKKSKVEIRYSVISNETYDVIKKYLTDRAVVKADAPLFITHTVNQYSGCRLTEKGAQESFQKILEASGMRKGAFSPKSLKKTFYTKLLDAKVTPEQISVSTFDSAELIRRNFPILIQQQSNTPLSSYL